MAARSRRGEKIAVGMVAQSFLRSEHADQAIDLVVVGRHVVVGNRPVVAESVVAFRLEIVGAEAKRDAAPVIRAAAEHSRAPPVELRSFGFRVRLAVELPAADARVEFTERAFFRARAATGRLIWPFHHGRILRVVPRTAGFEHHDVRTGLGEDVRGHAAARAGAHDGDVVHQAFGRLHQPWNERL